MRGHGIGRRAFGLVLLFGLAGCGGAGSPTPTPAAKSNQPVAPPTITINMPQPPAPPAAPLPKADFTLTAQELAKAYADPAAADKKYKQKAVRVTGVVEGVGKDSVGVVIVKLKGDGKVSIQCGIPADAAAQATALKPGTEATVQGECFGLVDGSVAINFCAVGP